MEIQQKQRQKQRQMSLSHLPIELICKILECLEEFEDILASSAVCRAWRFQVETLHPVFNFIAPFLKNIDTGKQPVLPPLLLVSNIDNIDNSRRFEFSYKYSDQDYSCALFNTETHKTHKILLSELKRRWFSSSSFGWLLTISSNETENLSLLNPFTKAQIELPPPPPLLTSPLRRQYLRVITSKIPSDPNCVVLASHILSFELAFFRPAASEKTWTIIANEFQEFVGFCNDTIFYKGDFYALDIHGDIFRIDLERFILVKLPVKRVNNYIYWHYLVELNEDLLLVSRITPDPYTPPKFLIYKLDWEKEEWVLKKNIGNNAIVLGKHGSESLLVTEEITKFQANCIYFVVDDIIVVGSPIPGIGVYNMKTQHSEWLYQDLPIRESYLNWFRIDRRTLNSDSYT